jgi:hypothetical protein
MASLSRALSSICPEGNSNPRVVDGSEHAVGVQKKEGQSPVEAARTTPGTSVAGVRGAVRPSQGAEHEVVRVAGEHGVSVADHEIGRLGLSAFRAVVNPGKVFSRGLSFLRT